MRILIADDDLHLRRGIADLLSMEDYTCLTAADGEEAWRIFQEQKPDFCILDVMMPRMDGLELCRRIRAHNDQVPILLLTARGLEMDRVVGLQSGADDYVAKPFGTMELVARIKAISRRVAAPLKKVPVALRLDDLEVDCLGLRASRNGTIIDLTPRDILILQTLFERAGKAVSRDELFDICWGRDFMPNSRALDQYISALRRKIESDPAAPRIVRTVHGVGYRYDPD